MANTLNANTADSLSSSQQIQRKAFYTGLISILTEEQANEALVKWATFINETGSAFNGLNSFARDVCKNYHKDNQQRDLVRALNRALFYKDKTAANKDEVKTPVIAMDPTLDADQSILMDQPISTTDFQTFEYLFVKILKLVKAHSNETSMALHPFLNELIQSMPWSETQQQQITILIDSGTTTQMRAYRPDQLKTFLKHLRSWLVDEIGKQEAEALLIQAIKETEQQSVSVKYSPLNFV
ncbi:MAG: hypothetical protein H0W85_00685 [Methylotenera sp.]|nr:hypothetical protein [Methylotenera sp.]